MLATAVRLVPALVLVLVLVVAAVQLLTTAFGVVVLVVVVLVVVVLVVLVVLVHLACRSPGERAAHHGVAEADCGPRAAVLGV
jgi:hypothetical protein